MVLVNATKGPNTVHGLGLIAREFVPAGAAVWRFQPGFDLALPETLLDLLSPAAREQVLFYAYFDPAARVYFLSADDRFTNHSDGANTANEGYLRTVALRDIRPGEEITWSYRGWESPAATFVTDPDGVRESS